MAEHVTIENLASTFAAAGSDIATVFRWVFLAATAGLLISLVSLCLMEEKPLRGAARPAAASTE